MTRALFDNALQAAHDFHAAAPALTEFAPWPTDLSWAERPSTSVPGDTRLHISERPYKTDLPYVGGATTKNGKLYATAPPDLVLRQTLKVWALRSLTGASHDFFFA